MTADPGRNNIILATDAIYFLKGRETELPAGGRAAGEGSVPSVSLMLALPRVARSQARRAIFSRGSGSSQAKFSPVIAWIEPSG